MLQHDKQRTRRRRRLREAHIQQRELIEPHFEVLGHAPRRLVKRNDTEEAVIAMNRNSAVCGVNSGGRRRICRATNVLGRISLDECL
jgi:hypothetical protein